MKKTILALTIATLSFNAAALTSPADKKGYELLEEMARTEEGKTLVAQMQHAMEDGTDEEKTAFSNTLVEFVNGHDNKVAVLLALDNVNVNNKSDYSSALDQLIEGGWVNLTPDQKAHYNDYQAKKAERRGSEGDEHKVKNGDLTAAIQYNKSKNTKEGDLNFSHTVEPTCGINITDAEGSLNFRDTVGIDEAKFIVRTNVTSGATITLETQESAQSLGSIEYNLGAGKTVKDGEELTAQNNEMVNVYAQSDLDSRNLDAGEYSVATTVTISCI